MLGRFWSKNDKLEPEKINQHILNEDTKSQDIVVEDSCDSSNVEKFPYFLKNDYDLKIIFHKMMALNPKSTCLHVSSGVPLYIRYKENLVPVSSPLEIDDVEKILYQYCKEDIICKFKEQCKIEFYNEISGVTHFRANLFKGPNIMGGVFTILNFINRDNIPEIYNDLLNRSKGLIIISGSDNKEIINKISELIYMIDEVQRKKIVIFGELGEYCLDNKSFKSLIIHKKKSTIKDIKFFFAQDVDIIVIPDIESSEVFSLCIEAVHRGNMVIGGFYTDGVIKTLERLINFFPETSCKDICINLSDSLEAIISYFNVNQKLNEEILLCNTEIKNLIRENNISSIQLNRDVSLHDDELETLFKTIE